MQMRVYKQFYMIFVLLRACLWNVGSSFADNNDGKVNTAKQSRSVNKKYITVLASEAVYVADNIGETEQQDFLKTQVSQAAALPVFHRDKIYNSKNLSEQRARFLRLLLYPNHSFG